MFEQKLTEIFKKYPESLSERSRFQGVLRDFFPEDRLHANLLMMAYDVGIHSDIAAKERLTSAMFRSYKRILTSEYGISEENALWCVHTWFSVYGISVLGKENVNDFPGNKGFIPKVIKPVAEPGAVMENAQSGAVIEHTEPGVPTDKSRAEMLKNRVDLSRYDDGQKLPRNIVSRQNAVEQQLGITNIKCTFCKNDWFGDCGCLKVMGEIFGQELACDYILIFFTVYNDSGEIIGANFGEKISKDEFNGYHTFSRNIDIPKDEFISEIRIRPVVDPYFAD